jgi:hypothetical protein
MNDLSGSNYSDIRNYPDRYHSYAYPNSVGHSHYTNSHRMNHHARHGNNNDHVDRRPHHADDYPDGRHRKEKVSTKATSVFV